MIIKINTYADKPIYEQLCEEIILGIASGQLTEGEPLPSARSLAADLGVNFHTVNKAYDLLRESGYILMNKRTTAVVAGIRTGTLPKDFAQKLALCAAEAICGGLSESEFSVICAENYKNLKEGLKNE